jgi:hypothetical protein
MQSGIEGFFLRTSDTEMHSLHARLHRTLRAF